MLSKDDVDSARVGSKMYGLSRYLAVSTHESTRSVPQDDTHIATTNLSCERLMVLLRSLHMPSKHQAARASLRDHRTCDTRGVNGKTVENKAS